MALRSHTHDMCSTPTWWRSGGRCLRTASASTSSRMRPTTPSAMAPTTAPQGSALSPGTPREEQSVTWQARAIVSTSSWMNVPLLLGTDQSFRSGATDGALRRLLSQTHYGAANTARAGALPNQQTVLQALNQSFSSGAHDWSHRVTGLPRLSRHQTCNLEALYRCRSYCVRGVSLAL